MIQPVLLLLLLALRASSVLVTEVSLLEGSSVTLVCGYPVKDRGYYTCWGRNCENRWNGCDCSNPIVKMNGGIITFNDSKMHSLSGKDLTISNLQDSRNYCCCVDSSILPYNDHVTYYSLKVVKGCERNLMNGVAFRINITEVTFVPQDASQCRQKCTELYNCQYFTFVGKEAKIDNTNRDMCFLKASTGDRPVTIQYLQHATSGYALRNCSGKVTYSAKKYTLVQENENWNDAKEYCRQHYTNLSIVHTEEDWKAIQASLGNFSGDVWIGLRGDKPDPNEKWKWSDGEDFMFLNWATEFNKNMGHDCVISTSSHWQAEDCHNQKQYVCQQLDERPSNTTGDLTTPVTPETTSPTSTGPTSIKTSTTTSATLLPPTNSGQSTTSPTTTTNGQSTTSRPTNTNGKSTISPPTTTNGQPTTSPTTTTNGQSTTSRPTTTNGQFTTSPPTTNNGKSTTSPTTTTNGQSTTSPPTTTNGQSTTSQTTTTNKQSTTSPPTTTIGQSTTPSTSTSSGQLTSLGPTSPDRKPTSSPSSAISPLHPDYLHYFNESKSWINALKFCKSRHSNLVHITNQTVQTDLTQLLANVELPCGGVWIGLERSIFEWSAPWLWTSGDVDKVVKYSEWHSCFPLNPMNYHCDLH